MTGFCGKCRFNLVMNCFKETLFFFFFSPVAASSFRSVSVLEPPHQHLGKRLNFYIFTPSCVVRPHSNFTFHVVNC